MTSSMFAPLHSEAVSGGDPRNAASTGQQLQSRTGGGFLLAVDSLIAGGSSSSSSNAASSGLSTGYEAECTTVHYQPRPRSQQHHTHHQQQGVEGLPNETDKRRIDESLFAHKVGVHSYSADMQPAATFYLGFNAHLPSHQGHFGATGFAPPYMSHYPLTTSLSPYNNPLHHQQQPAQSLQARSPHLSHQHQPQQKNAAAAAAAAAAAVAAAASAGSGRSLMPTMSSYTNCYPGTSSYGFGDTKSGLGHSDLGGNQDHRNSSYGTINDNGMPNDQQLKAEPPFLARPQPTRAIPALDPCNSHGASTSTSSSLQNTSSESLHRSQTSSSPATTTLSTSAMAFRDKLGLRSPPVTHPSPVNASGGAGNCLSPAADARCPSRSPNSLATSNHKFRYPSGPSTASIGSSPRQSVAGEGGCPTPLSALSSREGTPIPPPQKSEEHAPNVDISRVQIEEREKRSSLISQVLSSTPGFLKSEASNPLISSMKTEQSEFKQEPPHHIQMKEEPPPYNCMKPESHSNFVKLDSPSFGDNFHKYLHEGRDQGQLMLSHQQSQAHLLAHPMQQLPLSQQYSSFGSGNNNPLSPSASDGANNNLQSRPSSTIQHRPKNIYDMNHSRGLHHPGNYHPIHGGGYSGTLHYPGSDSLGSQGPSHGGVPPSSVSSRMAGLSSRGGVSSVKIGRRPSHLPKVLKFQDVTLPPGWIRKLKCRKHGKQAGRWDVYIYSPCGVKFASRKKLKSFFEKNNLNYDPEDFDFTPYGRHSDHGGRGGGGGSHASSANGNRHNSSGSTGSEATHAGSSPASIPNYSPTHLGASTSYNPHGIMTSGFAGSSDYTSFNAFDPHMENPPNVNAMDVHRGDNFSSSIGPSAGHMNDPMGPGNNRNTLEYHPGRGHHQPIKNESGEGNYLDMADFFGDSSTAVAVAAALPLHNGAIYPQTSSAHPVNSQFPDLSQGLGGSLMGHQVNPLSNASMGSRCSDDDLDDVGVGVGGIGVSKSQDMSELGKAFNSVMNDEFAYH